MKLIVTRPSPDGEAFAEAARAVGAEPVLSPVMVIRPRTAPIAIGDASAFAFTSANGVRAYAALSGKRNALVFAVGEATAEAARATGFTNVVAASGDVQSLAALIAATKSSPPVVHFAGSERAGDLVRELADLGVVARREVIYAAEPAPDLSPAATAILADDSIKFAVVFFSPRSARLFLQQVRRKDFEPTLVRGAALCLSAEIASALGETAWRKTEVSAARSADDMLALIRGQIGSRAHPSGAAR